MSKGPEAERDHQVASEDQGMIRFDHMRRETDGEVRMEVRIKVWLGKALMPGRGVW